jgi:hypothetical protein
VKVTCQAPDLYKALRLMRPYAGEHLVFDGVQAEAGAYLGIGASTPRFGGTYRMPTAIEESGDFLVDTRKLTTLLAGWRGEVTLHDDRRGKLRLTGTGSATLQTLATDTLPAFRPPPEELLGLTIDEALALRSTAVGLDEEWGYIQLDGLEKGTVLRASATDRVTLITRRIPLIRAAPTFDRWSFPVALLDFVKATAALRGVDPIKPVVRLGQDASTCFAYVGNFASLYTPRLAKERRIDPAPFLAKAADFTLTVDRVSLVKGLAQCQTIKLTVAFQLRDEQLIVTTSQRGEEVAWPVTTHAVEGRLPAGIKLPGPNLTAALGTLATEQVVLKGVGKALSVAAGEHVCFVGMTT